MKLSVLLKIITKSVWVLSPFIPALLCQLSPLRSTRYAIDSLINLPWNLKLARSYLSPVLCKYWFWILSLSLCIWKVSSIRYGRFAHNFSFHIRIGVLLMCDRKVWGFSCRCWFLMACDVNGFIYPFLTGAVCLVDQHFFLSPKAISLTLHIFIWDLKFGST